MKICLHSYPLSKQHIENDFNSPIYNVQSPDIVCNGGPNPLKRPFSKKVISVKAGDTVTTVWHHTLEGLKRGDAEDPINKGHLGPTLAYMAKVADATTENVRGLKWF